MGDPETEAVFPRIESDLIEMFEGMAYGELDKYELKVSPRTAATVVCVSEGYPGAYEKGMPITGLDQSTDSLIFHAGTALKNRQTVTAGGRVLAVTSMGETISEAVGTSLETIRSIDYAGKYFRSDIGQDLIQWAKK